MTAAHPRRSSLIGLVLLCSCLSARVARAEDWVYQSDELEDRADALIRFSTRFDVWASVFDRPPRACDSSQVLVSDPGSFGESSGASPPRSGDFYCPSSSSYELAVGTGIQVAFRVLSPLYLTAGIDILYTTPDISQLKNQVIIPVPFGILFTEYAWSLRPIIHVAITPILYLTDDARDYTLGGDLGFAWRVLGWGDLSFTVGYRTADTVSSWQVELALHPVP